MKTTAESKQFAARSRTQQVSNDGNNGDGANATVLFFAGAISGIAEAIIVHHLTWSKRVINSIQALTMVFFEH